jgi:hypothetical protein
MSRINEHIRQAKLKGYTVNEHGQVFNPKGKPLKGNVKTRVEKRLSKGSGSYSSHYFSVYVSGRSLPIPTHRFIAYLKFGEDALNEGIVTRHLNDDSLDNSWSNIAIGTTYDNHMDAVRNGKVQVTQ